MGLLKTLILPLTAIILLLSLFSLLGLGPAAIVNQDTRTYIYTNEETTDSVLKLGDLSGTISGWESGADYGLTSASIEFFADIGSSVDNPLLYLFFNTSVRWSINNVVVQTDHIFDGYAFSLYDGGTYLDIFDTNLLPDTPPNQVVDGDLVEIEIITTGKIIFSGVGSTTVLERTLTEHLLAITTINVDIGSVQEGFGTLDGHVQTTGGVAIPGVTVSIASLSGTSDSNGDFLIGNIPSGDYTVTASKSGYKSYIDDTVTIRADVTRTKTITLISISEDPIDPDLDSDGDGFTDVEEIAAGTDPFDPNDFPSDQDELPSFAWDNTVTILVIIGFIIAIIIFLVFKGGFLGLLLAGISLAVFMLVAWLAGSGLWVG